jgi:hypothetical protein
LTVRGDSRDGSLNGDEIGIIAEKSFASLLGQPFVFAKIMTPKIADHDAASSLVILLEAMPDQGGEVVSSNANGHDRL